jgi:hypothetical protein
MTPTREWLTARLTGLAVSASLESLTLAVALLENLPTRDISPASLMAAQRAREDETDDPQRTVGPWRDDGGHWMVVRETHDRTDYAACASDGAWTVYAYEENPNPEEPAEPFAAGYEDGIEANQAAADAHLIAAGWTGRVRDREVDPDAAMLGRALALVVREVERATALHGRTFPGGWGLHARAVDREARQRAQDACDAAQGSGGASFRDVLDEEIAEVYAEEPGSPEHVREMAQVAAVNVRGMLFADFFRRVRASMGSEVQGGS